MTVILDESDEWAHPSLRCTVCDEPLRVPFVHWICSDSDIWVCAKMLPLDPSWPHG